MIQILKSAAASTFGELACSYYTRHSSTVVAEQFPKQWAKYIANPQNKANLCDFVTTTMSHLGMENLTIGKDGERTVYITNTICDDLEELRSTMKRQTRDYSYSLHAKYATQPSSRIIIQFPDTDVLVLCGFALWCYCLR